MSNKNIALENFVAGGVLPADSPAYVNRPADNELYDLVLAGEYCHVLSSRQMGKSSLMVNVARRLRKQGVATAFFYLSGIRPDPRIERWYLGLLSRLKLQLNFSLDPAEWWAEQSFPDASQRFIGFLRDVVLEEIEGSLVIFIDEIEAAINSTFVDDFLAAIRSAYQSRKSDPVYQRLTFVFLGTTTPAELIKDPNRSPFSVSRPVELKEFDYEEMQVLQQKLQTMWPDYGQAILARIFYWTDGHPYLTQKLCSSVAELGQDAIWVDVQLENQVDWLVKKQLLDPEGFDDLNLQLVCQAIEDSPQRRRLLNLYRKAYLGQATSKDGGSAIENRLRLLGLVKPKNGSLTVSNQIYRQAFNLGWVKTNTSLDPAWKRVLIAALVLVVLLLVGGTGFFIFQQRQGMIATQEQNLTSQFKTTADPKERLSALAELFDLGGHDEEARQLFYEGLSRSEQLALFQLDDPEAWVDELRTVTRGIYTSPKVVVNGEQENALLEAVVTPLRQLDYSKHLDVIDLELELTNWLKGREYYIQDQDRRAIDAYNVAINLNDKNPGLYFDRGQAYAALGESNQALADFATVLSLDPNWEDRIRQALRANGELYNALWSENGYQTLAMLVPSPTNTPTPTVTPTPSATPTPTHTPTPLPPTATSTATPSPTPTVRLSGLESAKSPTSTPDITTGAFTLIKPTFEDDPSHGLTTFEWQWTGGLPPGYGFEVRVWSEGQPNHTGAHNAVLDNQNGNVERIGNNTYRLKTDIKEAAGVAGKTGEYLWTVGLVQISPEFADLGQEAEPERMRFAAIFQGSGGSGGDGGGGSGGVGID